MNQTKDETILKVETKLLKTAKVYIKNFYEKNPFYNEWMEIYMKYTESQLVSNEWFEGEEEDIERE
jgi:hypothetical protein